MFSALNDDKLYAVYLFPAIYRESIEGMNRYWNELQLAKKQGQLNFIPVDFAFISKDIINLIEREAPPGLLLIGLFLGIVLLFTVRPPGRALILFLNLFGSLVFLSGVLYLFGIRLNIMNIGVIPIILGTGIDCFIHFNHRFDETWDIQKTLKDQLPSIFVSNLTSIVGFGGLILTSNLGLRSVGLVAALGLIIVTIICAFIFPRCLALSATRKVRLVELDKEAIRA
jgi:hypothetical protein